MSHQSPLLRRALWPRGVRDRRRRGCESANKERRFLKSAIQCFSRPSAAPPPSSWSPRPRSRAEPVPSSRRAGFDQPSCLPHARAACDAVLVRVARHRLSRRWRRWSGILNHCGYNGFVRRCGSRQADSSRPDAPQLVAPSDDGAILYAAPRPPTPASAAARRVGRDRPPHARRRGRTDFRSYR